MITSVKKCRVSVVIPVYNVESYLEKCLNSIVEQTETFDEVILVNDGSTDNSLAICEQYISQYAYFKLISQQNQGLSAARNTGLSAVSSEYVMFLDSDDWLREDTVSALKKNILEKDYDVVYYDADVFFEGVKGSGRNHYDRRLAQIDMEFATGWEYFERTYPRYYIVSSCMALYKKSLIDRWNLSFPEGMLYEDNYFSFCFWDKAQKVTHVSELFYQRRYRKDSIMMSNYTERKFVDHIQCVELIWKEIENWPDVIRQVRRAFALQLVQGHFNAILNNYQQCSVNGVLLSENAHNKLQIIVEKYFKMLKLLQIKLENETWANVVMMMKCISKILRWKLNGEDNLRTTLKILAKHLHDMYVNLLEKLPLGEAGIKVGIYGSGGHTEGLLKLYKYFVGEIKCEIVFIDSVKDNILYHNKPLVCCQRVDDSFKWVIVSSFLYEKEMLDNLKKINVELPVIRFYNEITMDIFSDYSFLDFLDK